MKMGLGLALLGHNFRELTMCNREEIHTKTKPESYACHLVCVLAGAFACPNRPCHTNTWLSNLVNSEEGSQSLLTLLFSMHVTTRALC